MNKFIVFLAALSIAANLSLGQVGIKSDNTSPDNSAMLDVSSTEKGLLVPRMTSSERQAIISPAIGLMVYQTDEPAGFYYHDSAGWIAVASNLDIGMLLSIIEGLSAGVYDKDGNHYDAVVIGNQVWMASNLMVTRFNDGTTIPNVTGNPDWMNTTDPAYCWYNDDSATYGSVYGALYNWYAVEQGNLCPIGWHVPSLGEWTTLINYLGGSAVAGGKLKEQGTSHWISPNAGATDEYRFRGLPGGARYNVVFDYIGEDADWWTSDTTLYDQAWYVIAIYYSADSYYDYYDKYTGFSVRCLKDY